LSSNPITQIENLPNSLLKLDLRLNGHGRIENLPNGLQELNLSFSQIYRIENLPRTLQKLDLIHNNINKIENLPDGLQGLSLASNQISRIENLPDGLQSLWLAENQIQQIENLPDGLQHLWLETNQIRRIENLPDTLQSLGLSENQIRQIENLPISLTSLELSKNPTVNIPSEVLGNGGRVNCLSDVRGWFADLAVGQVKNNTVRLMVTGNGNVGKSSLITALQHGRCDEDIPSTHGIRVDLVTIRDQEGQPVIMQVFDFGGQELYHGTHSLFMRARAVQMLVFDTETETTAQTPDRITGETVRNQPLAYWADQITELSPNNPVVLVQNKLDRPMNRPPEIVATIAEFEIKGVTVAGVSATTGKGIPGLRGHLLEAAQQLPELGMAIPMSWHNVRQFFLDNIQRPLASRRRLMTPAEFTDLCRRENVLPNSDNALLRYLHNTGAVYADSQYLPDTIIADQQWAIEGIYKALDRRGDLYELLRNLSFGKCELQLILRVCFEI
jgi:GTPase SAR1 family protein